MCPVKVIELGSYIVPAYAGMILAEQGFAVEKWVLEDKQDPILRLEIGGPELWSWINHKKDMRACHAKHIERQLAYLWNADQPVIVIDNIKKSTWEHWGIDIENLATKYKLVWVSLRSDVGETSFDMLAQARAWGDIAPYIPFYIGDTTGGLWLAFSALSRFALKKTGHHVIYHATSLAKLVEGEMVVEPNRDLESTPWDEPGSYYHDALMKTYQVEFKGETYTEKPRDSQWRRENLKHKDGRFTI